MDLAREPDGRLAVEVLPGPLLDGLRHVFTQGGDGVMLVGGTALAGYYAGHRRSDDLDLFTRDEPAQRATVLAVESLTELGAELADARSSARFYHVSCRLRDHDFTVQVVLDPHVFALGGARQMDDGVVVAGLDALLRMKAATLVSRASEKDLYDLAWFFRQSDRLEARTLIELGREVDRGMNAEAVLMSLVATEMRESACGFAISRAPEEVFTEVSRVRQALISGVEAVLREQPPPPIADLIRTLM